MYLEKAFDLVVADAPVEAVPATEVSVARPVAKDTEGIASGDDKGRKIISTITV